MSDRLQPKLTPPYGEFFKRLLESIFEALLLLSKKAIEDKVPSDASLKDCYKWLIDDEFFESTFLGINRHLTMGLDNEKESSRLVKLTKLAFYQAQSERTPKAVFLPSPLKIMLDALTVPDEPSSRAYALLTCRTFLFERFKIHPKSKMAPKDGWSTLEVSSIRESLASMRTYTRHRDNIPKFDNIDKLFLAHFLAMNGVLLLRFGTESKKIILDKHMSFNKRTEYCKEHDIIGTLDYEFRTSPNYNDFPESDNLINQIWGIPLPLRGADTVFFGGLKVSSDESLVISVTGKAGTGKTSMGLALASALAPIGTVTYYITFEENPEDLKYRLISLIPNYLNKLSICPNSDKSEWFYPHQSALEPLEEFIRNHLNKIKAVTINYKDKLVLDSVPNPCPLMVVIDGVSLLCEASCENQDRAYIVLHKFIRSCRELNVLVVLLSGENDNLLHRLDYLVDTVITLKYEGTDKFDQKPIRVLQLLKSRHQISRPGSHIFHLSGQEGFRISPQLPSQLDRQQKINYYLPDKQQVINTLNKVVTKIGKNNYIVETNPFINLFHGSRILLHGQGSSGKAGLALKILLTQPQLNSEQKNDQYVNPLLKRGRRVLVLSFLYPETYYKHLETKLTLSKAFKLEYPGYPKSKVEVLPFDPGFIQPEDLLSRVIRKLVTAELEGEPFTGVLLDGLHNVFLQFPYLQSHDMIWPMLYNILVRSKVTTLTTFTTFSIPLKEKETEEYDNMMIKGHIPFLHALVQATDFYVYLKPASEGKKHRIYQLAVKEAIYQNVPTGELFWNREEMYFEKTKENKS
jgi:KaiC/GvpD/RAD55 family RecA-like ATPase